MIRMEKDVKTTPVVADGPNYKGAYQYITRKKKAYVLKTVLYVCIGIAIYVLGLCLNKFQSSNIFTIFAILMVLPGAKAFVAIVVFWPFRSVEYDRVHQVYEALKEQFPEMEAEDKVLRLPEAIDGKLNVYMDMVFTSTQKVMNLDFFIVTESRMIGLMGNQKQKLSYVQSYLGDCMKNRELPFGVKIYEKEEAFLKAIKELKVSDVEMDEKSKKDREEAIDFIEASIVK